MFSAVAVLPLWVVIALTVLNVGLLVAFLFIAVPIKTRLQVNDSRINNLVERVTNSNLLISHATETVQRMTGQFRAEANKIGEALDDADTLIRGIREKATVMINGVRNMEQEGIALEEKMAEVRPKNKRKNTPSKS